MKLSKEAMKNAKKVVSRKNWRDTIVEYLTADNCKNNGASVVEIYDATRTPNKDGKYIAKRSGQELTGGDKAVHMSSQMNYLMSDGYLLEKGHDGKHTTLSIVAKADGTVFEGAEELAQKYV